MNRKIIFGSLLTLVLMASCQNHNNQHHQEHGGTFQVTSPLKKDTATTKEYVAQIHSSQHIELRALERGYLQNIYVDEGQFVKKGQRMFQVMPNIYEAELAKAKSEAHVAEIEYLNTKALADSDVVSPNELAMTKARFDKALAEQELAQAHMDFTEVKAPFDGIMDKFHVRLGSLLDEGEMLTSLSNNSEMWVYFNVPEAEYLDYKTQVKQDSIITLQLKMANQKMFPYEGKLTTIEADFNPETGNIAFRATFPNPDGLLRHGETGNIIMQVPLKNTLLIPQKTTFEVLDKKYVFVVNKENKLETRHIKVEAELPHLYAVSYGLQEGDKILLEGLRKVRNGQEIEYEFVDPKKALSELDLYAE